MQELAQNGVSTDMLSLSHILHACEFASLVPFDLKIYPFARDSLRVLGFQTKNITHEEALMSVQKKKRSSLCAGSKVF